MSIENVDKPIFPDGFYPLLRTDFDVAVIYKNLRTALRIDGLFINSLEIDNKIYLLQSFYVSNLCASNTNVSIADIAVCWGYDDDLDAATFDLTQCFVGYYFEGVELKKKVCEIIQTGDVSNIVLALKDVVLLDSLSVLNNYFEIVKILDFESQCEVAGAVYQNSDTDNFIAMMQAFPEVLEEMKNKIKGLKIDQI